MVELLLAGSLGVELAQQRQLLASKEAPLDGELNGFQLHIASALVPFPACICEVLRHDDPQKIVALDLDDVIETARIEPLQIFRLTQASALHVSVRDLVSIASLACAHHPHGQMRPWVSREYPRCGTR